MKTFEWIGFHDGYAIVGICYECPYCGHEHKFVSDDFEEKICDVCGEISMPETECFEW